MLQIALLGPLRVQRDGQHVRVPDGKTSELLVRLALEAGTVVLADRLIDDLWAAGATSTRRNTLQSKVAMLRRALGDASSIVTGDGGYALAAGPCEVDALTVLSSLATASRLLDGGDQRGAAALCASTLALFRGEVREAAGDGDWVAPHRTRLHDARRALIEVDCSARLQLGDIGGAIAELEGAVASYPFHEGLWEMLITALYRSGRQVEALATYQRVKKHLSDELGLDPGPHLRRLEHQVLVQDPTLDVSRAAGERTTSERPSGNLPSMSAGLVGRDSEVAAVSRLVDRERLVEIVGAGGIGKTAVALAVGRSLLAERAVGSDGIWLARLETASSPQNVVDVLIAALEVGGEKALFERLKGSAALVILDNCEHLVDAAASLAVRLLDVGPDVRVLCTSQVPLGVDGEVVVVLDPLAEPDAIELFTRRATAQRLLDASSSGDDAVIALCRSLDGLPLAIELAAARTKTLSIVEITRRLDDRFQVLSDPTSRKAERRRSLRSTIRWSYDLLFPDDKRGLWALAVFAGGARLEAVEFVLAALGVPSAAAIDVVGRLASRSLLIVDDERAAGPSTAHPHGPPATTRYRLLDSIRAFALHAMNEAGASDDALSAHAAWFAEAARLSTAGVRSDHQAEYLSFARTERANIDAALQWCTSNHPLGAAQIVGGFGWAWVVLGDSKGARRIVDGLAAAGDAAPAAARAGALLVAAWIEASTGDVEPAREHIAAAADLADSIDDVELHGRCLYYLAYVVSHQGDFAGAMKLTADSRAIYDRLDRPWDQAANWLFAARAAIAAGDRDASAEAVAHLRRWLGEVNDPWLHVRGDAILGELALLQGRFGDAVEHLSRASETSRILGFRQTEAYQVTSLGRALCQEGKYEAGRAALQRAIEKAQETGDARLSALARVHLGRVLRTLGDVSRARIVLDEANAWHREHGGGEPAALGECLLAAIDSADRVPGAAEKLAVLLDDAQRKNDADVEIFALDALARDAALAGDTARARRFLEAADSRMATAAHYITGVDRIDAHWLTGGV